MKLQVQVFDFNTASRIGQTFYLDVKDQSDALTSIKAIIAFREAVDEHMDWLLYFDYGNEIDGEFVPWKMDYVLDVPSRQTFRDVLEWNNLEEYHASLAPDA
jgi:hypothetical protein